MVLSAKFRGREFPVDKGLDETAMSPFAMAVGGEHIVYVNLCDGTE